MRYLSRYRHPYYYSNPWNYNPDSWESDVRKLLYKVTGIGWKVGQSPPAEWHTPYLASHPEWSPLWLIATSLHTTPDELLAKIRPGKRKHRDVDELNVLYHFIKEHLVNHGQIRGKDVAALAKELGLASLSGPETDAAKERSYLLKQLVRDDLARQIMGRFRGSSHYLPTQKLLDEHAKQKPAATPLPPVSPVAPIATEVPIPLFQSESHEDMPGPITPEIQTEVFDPQQWMPGEWVPEPAPTPPPVKIKKGKQKDLQPTKKILIIGGQGSSCPDGTPSLRAIKKAECAWLDQNFRWKILVSYRNEEFRTTNLSKVDLVIIFSKFMGHSQVDIARAYCQKHDIPFIDNYQGSGLGSLQMAAEHAKKHGPKWFSAAYQDFHTERKKKKRPNPWIKSQDSRRHLSRRVGRYGNTNLRYY